MNFEWDDHKNSINIAKHGFDFADASRIFDAPMCVGLDRREDYGEDRWVGIGCLDGRVGSWFIPNLTIPLSGWFLCVKRFRMSGFVMSDISKTDWSRIDAMTDADIDTSDIPALPEEFFATARLRLPDAPQSRVAVPIDADTLAWFRSQGEDAERLMAVALRIYAEAHRAA
ncbi:BrnT family toxin [Methylomagnum ishizawai]|uniref:BrnT family toxin n=1 Tax=Methylomagnum ishizawai TaxID=1760988 RepID=UPI001FE8BF48|nr:BrnT family toxin [Methylomagnum ishizawai]